VRIVGHWRGKPFCVQGRLQEARRMGGLHEYGLVAERRKHYGAEPLSDVSAGWPDRSKLREVYADLRAKSGMPAFEATI